MNRTTTELELYFVTAFFHEDMALSKNCLSLTNLLCIEGGVALRIGQRFPNFYTLRPLNFFQKLTTLHPNKFK
jgi:hypothetical protein